MNKIEVNIQLSKEDRQALEGTMWEHKSLIVMDRIRKELKEVYDRVESQKDKDFYSLMETKWIEQDK